MKRFFFLALLSLFCLYSTAQTVDTRRKIEVSGTAEAEVTPDIIFVGISLKEYYRDGASKKKVDIETIEKQLQSVVLSAGIPKENFTINNIASYNYNWEKKKNPEFLARKQYRLKVTDLNKFNQILNSLDPKAIEYTNVESYDYSQIETLKRDLKIKALQAAKDKASYLAAAVNDRVGAALEVQEINNEFYPQPMYRANVAMAESKAADAAMPDIDFKKIKLNYQMRAVFELTK
ncbi:SIMPL domain-containing protein [Pedobacter sp. SYSU D00535]|uniref:SIMPL domain-containing protein n=1 Tax=Pedobacter sp. SYSU D00535 TaxID=2810308 RepID=UPI001A9675A7|nr:SIMPL domain-containing protein [Pedobacter sp. SYSU D00535]